MSESLSELGKVAAATPKLRYPLAHTISGVASITGVGEECCSSMPTPQVDSIAERCDRLRMELANIGDLAAKITGVHSPTSPNAATDMSPLNRIEFLLGECDASARELRVQLDRIYHRLTG